MAWPSSDQLKAEYAKLNDSALTTKVDRALAQSINRIKSRLAARYDVSTWNSATPPVLFDLSMRLAYGLFAFLVHTGAKLSASDEAAKSMLEQAEKELDQLANGEAVLVASDGSIISSRLSSTGYVYTRTDGPIFTPDAPETWATALPDEGGEMV